MQTFFRLLMSWWSVDRIRCAPGHSQLLKLEVGNRVLVRDRLWVVCDCHDRGLVGSSQESFDKVRGMRSGTTTQVRIPLMEQGTDRVASMLLEFSTENPADLRGFWLDTEGVSELFDGEAIPLCSSCQT